MAELNKTTILVGLAWVLVSYTLLTTVLRDWLHTMPIATSTFIILGGVLVIKILFNNILKYDYFNKDYKKGKK